ncbi:O-antigen ligase [Longimicrobium sp.]|jgi:O-antigen ligase|uniref:O-antigen ligase family protein n=1 Tax=Longimicrobium sp. TaxID=2029185 RepID=UPI002ED844A5
MATELLAAPGTATLPRPAFSARRRPPRQAALESAFATAYRGAETAFAVVAVYLMSHAVVLLVLEGSGSDAVGGAYEGNYVLRTMFASIHAVSLGLVAVRWRASLAAIARRPSVLALMALALASTAWSAAPDLTLRRSLALLGTTAFGVFLAARFEPRELLRVLGAALALLAVSSLAFALALPRLGVNHGIHAGAWQGVYTHKNILGKVMALGAMVFLLLRADLPRSRRWIGTSGVALCLFLLLMSTSKTALSVLVALFASAALFRLLRQRMDVAIMVFVGAVLVGGSAAALLATNWEASLAVLGKDPSLTGRVPMWEVLVRAIGREPWLGYGYNAFWLGDAGPSAQPLKEIGWETPTAHNGFLEVLLQLGITGLALFLVGYLSAFRQALGALRRTVTPDGLWPVLILTMTLLYNVSESVLLEKNNLNWALYVAAVCSPLLARPAAPGRGGWLRRPRAAPAGRPR